MFCPFCGKENENENAFCMYCGESLVELVDDIKISESEQVDDIQPPVGEQVEDLQPSELDQVEPLGVEQPQQPQSTRFEQAQYTHSPGPKQEKRPPKPKSTKLPLQRSASLSRTPIKHIALIAAGMLILAAVLVVIASSNISRIRASGEEYTYVVQEKNTSEPFVVVARMKAGGKNVLELANDRDGYIPSPIFDGISRKLFSPTGKNFAMREQNTSGDLMLFSDDGSIPVYLGYRDLISLAEGFSQDGKYFALSYYDRSTEELATHIYDTKGNQLLTYDAAVFGAFLPTGNRFVVFETDNTNNLTITGISAVDIITGDISFVTNLEEPFTRMNLFTSADGREIYFIQGAELMSVSTSGGAAKSIYKFDSANSLAFAAPDKKNLVILDVISGTNSADLILYDPASNRRVRIDKEVSYFSPLHNLYGEAPVKFSPDGRFVAYLANKDGKSELFVANIDSRQRTSMVSGSSWITFSFSPDKKRIAYIDGRSSTSGGSLFIREYDGSNRTRLDTNVWSIQFDSTGRYVYYSKPDNLSSRRPETELYRIRYDGKNKELLMPAEDGILTFVNTN
jgi:Tol biopolymer transport system component